MDREWVAVAVLATLVVLGLAAMFLFHEWYIRGNRWYHDAAFVVVISLVFAAGANLPTAVEYARDVQTCQTIITHADGYTVTTEVCY